MPERRFTDAEVAEIFQRATEVQAPQRSALTSTDGMTLAELQEIGREAGIAPDAVAIAARSLVDAGVQTGRTLLGFPIGVGRTVDLERKISDQEWEQIVVDLRQTFDARGRVRQEGSFHQWTNGNLQALLEPTPTGHRLRLKTFNANARNMMMTGLTVAGVAAAVAIGRLVAGAGVRRPGEYLAIVVAGAAVFAIGALRLPAWARLRQQQMKDVISRVTLLSSKSSDDR
jgi:hypothetical protein